MTASWAYAVWALLGMAALVAWAVSHTTSRGRILVRPTEVLARLAVDPWLRIALLLGWAWVGWHLFAR